MGWREIRKYTDRSVDRIGKAEYERQRQWNEGLDTLGEGVSLWQKHTQGKKDQTALEQFGESEGLTFDKKTKSFYGTQDDQAYKISPAELKNMQNFSKYTDKGISDFISTKDGNIKRGYQYDLPDSPDRPSVDDEFQPSDTSAETIKSSDYKDTGDAGVIRQKAPIDTGTGEFDEMPDASEFDVYEDPRSMEQLISVGPGFMSAGSKGWKTAADVDAEFQKNAQTINKAKEDEMKNLLDIQRKKQTEFDAKVEADKKFQEEERIRLENIKNVESLNKIDSTSRWINPGNKQQSAMSVMFNGRK